MIEGLDLEVEDLRPVLSRMLPPDWERRIAARDQAALDAAVRRAWLVVYHRARSRVADRREAEEVAQEVFCRVLARLSSRAPEEEALRSGYLVRAAQNLLADRWRVRDLRRAADARYAEGLLAAPEAPEEHVLRQEEAESLRRALGRLPPLQRQVLRLRIFEQLTAAETAAVVGRSAEAVRQIQHRALATLRADLRREGAP